MPSFEWMLPTIDRTGSADRSASLATMFETTSESVLRKASSCTNSRSSLSPSSEQDGQVGLSQDVSILDHQEEPGRHRVADEPDVHAASQAQFALIRHVVEDAEVAFEQDDRLTKLGGFDITSDRGDDTARLVAA